MGFPHSGLSSIALNRTQFTNWFIYMMFKFSNEKYLAPPPNVLILPKVSVLFQILLEILREFYS